MSRAVRRGNILIVNYEPLGGSFHHETKVVVAYTDTYRRRTISNGKIVERRYEVLKVRVFDTFEEALRFAQKLPPTIRVEIRLPIRKKVHVSEKTKSRPEARPIKPLPVASNIT